MYHSSHLCDQESATLIIAFILLIIASQVVPRDSLRLLEDSFAYLVVVTYVWHINVVKLLLAYHVHWIHTIVVIVVQ